MRRDSPARTRSRAREPARQAAPLAWAPRGRPAAHRVPRRRPRAGAALLGGRCWRRRSRRAARARARAGRAGARRRRGGRGRPRARARARATASRSPTSRSTTSPPPWSGSSRWAARSSTPASAGRSAATPRGAPSGSGRAQPAPERGALRSALSSTIVTGPSFSRLTAIAAPKRPRSTGTPSRRHARRRRPRPAARPPRAARPPTTRGGCPRRTSPSSVNWLTHRTPAPGTSSRGGRRGARRRRARAAGRSCGQAGRRPRARRRRRPRPARAGPGRSRRPPPRPPSTRAQRTLWSTTRTRRDRSRAGCGYHRRDGRRPRPHRALPRADRRRGRAARRARVGRAAALGQARRRRRRWLTVRERTLTIRAFVLRGPDRDHEDVYRRLLHKNLDDVPLALRDRRRRRRLPGLRRPPRRRSTPTPSTACWARSARWWTRPTRASSGPGFDVPEGTEFRPPPGPGRLALLDPGAEALGEAVVARGHRVAEAVERAGEAVVGVAVGGRQLDGGGELLGGAAVGARRRGTRGRGPRGSTPCRARAPSPARGRRRPGGTRAPRAASVPWRKAS